MPSTKSLCGAKQKSWLPAVQLYNNNTISNPSKRESKSEYITMTVMKSHFSRVMERVRDPRFSFKSTRVIELRLTYEKCHGKKSHTPPTVKARKKNINL